jgi:glycosyltransferase involved in cell wall biosynthesis
MILGVTIHTYQRKDGQTPILLCRAIQSVINQSYQNFKIFIVGDKYEDNKEFEDIIGGFIEIADKIVYQNLPYAYERDKYLDINNTALWNCGGANALNYANNLALSHGITKVCHLDHDDIWLPNHLELIAKTIVEKNNPAFIYTLSKYLNNPVFPPMVVDGEVVEHLPAYCSLIHSSVYYDLEQIHLSYRDLWAEENRYFPSDGDMWDRISLKCQNENLKSYVIRQVTCVHEQENY